MTSSSESSGGFDPPLIEEAPPSTTDGETAAPPEPVAPPETVAPPEPVVPPGGTRAGPPGACSGAFDAYSIGDPGRAFTHAVPLPETRHVDIHDYVVDAATISDPGGVPRLILRAASGRGLAHQQYGDPRQDDHAFALSGDGEYLVGVVADGVSSGEWSHLAARVATEEGSAHVAALLRTTAPEDVAWRDVLSMLAERLRDVCATLPGGAAQVDLGWHEVATLMATTVVIGVVATRPDDDGEHAVTVVRLGDTSAWVLHPADGWVPLGEVKNAGNVIAESATACLPLVPDADPLVVQTTIPQGAVLLLLTDGVGDPLGGGRGEVGAALRRWWQTPPHPLEFAAQACFGRKTFDDDRGALGVWPVTSP